MSGWIKLHRQIVNSDIYHMPPLYLRVFERLILEANYQDTEIPYRERGSDVIGKRLIRRGERLTSIRQICEWVGWYERGVFKRPNPKTIISILRWLEGNSMIEIYGSEGNRTETHYRIVNYGVYQDINNDDPEIDSAKVTVEKHFDPFKVTVDGTSIRKIRSTEEVQEVEEGRGMENHPSPSPLELSILKELQSIDKYPFDYERDLEYIRMLLVEFADVNILDEVKRWVVYKLDKPLKTNSNARSQLRNWMANARKFAKERRDRHDGGHARHNKARGSDNTGAGRAARAGAQRPNTSDYTSGKYGGVFKRTVSAPGEDGGEPDSGTTC